MTIWCFLCCKGQHNTRLHCSLEENKVKENLTDLLRYVVFVLQMPPRPGCEALNHTLSLSRGQLLQGCQTFLYLEVAYNQKHTLNTRKEWTKPFVLWGSYSFAYFSLTGQLDDMKIVNLQRWELISFSDHQWVIQRCWQVLFQDVSNQCLDIKCNHGERTQQNINSKYLSLSLSFFFIP